jgi:hypothetical protein
VLAYCTGQQAADSISQCGEAEILPCRILYLMGGTGLLADRREWGYMKAQRNCHGASVSWVPTPFTVIHSFTTCNCECGTEVIWKKLSTTSLYIKYLSDITIKCCITVMLVIADLQTIFMQNYSMFMSYLFNQFHTCSSNRSFVITVKLKLKKLFAWP